MVVGNDGATARFRSEANGCRRREARTHPLIASRELLELAARRTMLTASKQRPRQTDARFDLPAGNLGRAPVRCDRSVPGAKPVVQPAELHEQIEVVAVLRLQRVERGCCLVELAGALQLASAKEGDLVVVRPHGVTGHKHEGADAELPREVSHEGCAHVFCNRRSRRVVRRRCAVQPSAAPFSRRNRPN